MKLIRTLAVASTSVVLLVGQAVAAFAHPQHEPPAVSITGPTRSATAKYHSLTVADKDGYSILADTPSESPASPNRDGCHGVRQSDLVKDPMIDPSILKPWSTPLISMADDTARGYVVIKSDWDATQSGPPSSGVGERGSPAPPMLFGHEFDFTAAPNRYGLPPFYSLHAWVWKDNPAGPFETWNPSVHCDPRPALGRQR
jgi:hypothetical protein